MQPITLQVRAALLVLAAVLLLRWRGTTRTLQRLARPGRVRHPAPPAPALRAVQRAGGRLHVPCLAQSVALAALLVRDGREPSVVLGVHRYEDRQWGSHAWVECDGIVLEPVLAGPHAELARCAAAQAWVPAQAAAEQTGEAQL
ncbi:MAG: Transglutaminase-like superfamily [Acidimicrobiaceae bacterium]